MEGDPLGEVGTLPASPVSPEPGGCWLTSTPHANAKHAKNAERANEGVSVATKRMGPF